MSDRETADEIEQAATAWVVKLDRARTPEMEAALEVWLAGDARRRGAFLQAEAAWAMLEPAHAVADLQEPPKRRGMGRRAFFLGGGLGLAAAAAGVAVLAWPGEQYETAIGEIRRVPLNDGSIVAINTQSRVEIEMAEASRTIALHRGEAWFQVAHDETRPFVVEAGGVRVRAVGTAFAVRRREGGADVIVTEGVVEVWSEAAGARTRLSAGERAFVADVAAVQQISNVPSEGDRLLAWRSGKIDLAGETLATAVAEFNRYNARHIEIAPSLAEERFYGVFRTDDPEGFARAVELSVGARARLDDPALIRIEDEVQ